MTNISDRTHSYSDEFKKLRCEIQECGKYQPYRVLIENTLAVQITMGPVKTQAVIFRNYLRKQQSLCLRLKKLFSSEDIIEEYFVLHYRTDFTFKKHMLVVETDDKGHNERPPNYEKERQEDLEKIG